MASHLQKAVQAAANRLHAAAVADNRVLDTTPMESRDSLNQPAYKDPYADGANMLNNAAYLIGEEEKLIVTLAEESLRFWKQRKASQEADPLFSTRAWDGADAELTDDRIKELESMIKVYS